MTANYTVSGSILPNFKVIQAFTGVLVTCKNEKDPSKYKGTRVVTTSYIDFSNAQGQLTPQFVI